MKIMWLLALTLVLSPLASNANPYLQEQSK